MLGTHVLAALVQEHAVERAHSALLKRLDMMESELGGAIAELRARERLSRWAWAADCPDVDIKNYRLFAYRAARRMRSFRTCCRSST